MLSLPHTPQALVVRKFRFAATRAAIDSCPGASVTAATLSSHILISCTASSRGSSPSVNRNPAARSMSSPGVRIVTVSGSPSTRISSGSSAASRSARCSAIPSTGTLSTRRLAVVPLISPRLAPQSRMPGPAGGRARHLTGGEANRTVSWRSRAAAGRGSGDAAWTATASRADGSARGSGRVRGRSRPACAGCRRRGRTAWP